MTISSVSPNSMLPVPELPDAGVSAVRSDTYTVQRGDTLSAIAQQHGVSLDALIAANPDITNPDLIYPDQQLTIPNGGNPTGEEPTAPAPGGEKPPTAPGGETPPAAPGGETPPAAPGGETPPAAPGGETPPAGGNPPPNGPMEYQPYTVYSTGNAGPISLTDASQMQPHHTYQTKERNGQTLEVRDVVLHREGQSQEQQAIPSPMEGTVVSAGPMDGAGNAVVIRNAQGQETWIFHMSSIDVQVGQQVSYGQDLGNQGNTGNSTGPHVHIEAPSDVIRTWTNDLLDGKFDGQKG